VKNINKNIIILSSITHATKLSDNIIMFAGLLITFIHEFFHILRRTIIHEACNPFYERTSERKIASRDDIYVSEGGMQLEDRLFGKILETIGYLDGKFLLHYQNWSDNNHDDFKNLLDIQHNQDLLMNRKKNRWVIPSRGGIMYINYNDDKDDIETATTTTSSSSQRWDIAKCALSSPFYHIDG